MEGVSQYIYDGTNTDECQTRAVEEARMANSVLMPFVQQEVIIDSTMKFRHSHHDLKGSGLRHPPNPSNTEYPTEV